MLRSRRVSPESSCGGLWRRDHTHRRTHRSSEEPALRCANSSHGRRWAPPGSPMSVPICNFRAAFADMYFLHRYFMGRRELVAGSALIAGIAAGVGTGVGLVTAARGNVGGAPGISKALSRIGRYAGGGMLSGVGVIAGASALAGLIVYEGLTQADELGRSF